LALLLNLAVLFLDLALLFRLPNLLPLHLIADQPTTHTAKRATNGSASTWVANRSTNNGTSGRTEPDPS
jgi:hypothetical protein